MRKHASILLLAIAALTMFLAATAQAKTTGTTVVVTEGKPSEFGIKLAVKTVKLGAVTFSVTNSGNVPHDFKVCSAPTTAAPADTCAGKGTHSLSPMGGKATLTITFKKAGKYEYLCTVAGHATAGMKGILTVK